MTRGPRDSAHRKVKLYWSCVATVPAELSNWPDQERPRQPHRYRFGLKRWNGA